FFPVASSHPPCCRRLLWWRFHLSSVPKPLNAPLVERDESHRQRREFVCPPPQQRESLRAPCHSRQWPAHRHCSESARLQNRASVSRRAFPWPGWRRCLPPASAELQHSV